MHFKPTAPRLWLTMFLLFFHSIVFAQQKRITGTIRGEEGRPVVGATVTGKGTNMSTQTGSDGTFTLNVPQNVNTLIVTSVGYEAQEVTVGTSGNLTVSLRQTAAALNEVVVTTGYSTQRKKDITGAVAVVDVSSMKRIPTGTGGEALQGQASGVTVITSGQPGGGTDIRIRGFTSLAANDPLVIVDGVQGDLHNLNVNDIESLQVLKDASAAIYGVRGSNGVVIITTKKGRTGRPRVTYDNYFGMQEAGKGFDMANTQQLANAIWQQNINSGITMGQSGWGNPQFGFGATPVIPDYIIPRGYTLCNCPADSVVNPASYDINSVDRQITRANKEGTDWYHEIFRNAPMQNHNLQVSGGADKSSYLFSLNYLDQEGILRSTALKRYALRANTQFTIKDNIRIGENAYISYRDNPVVQNLNEGNPISFSYRQSPIIPAYDIMGNYAGTKAEGLGNSSNPVAIVERREKYNKGRNWDLQGNIFLEIDFLRHFTARTNLGSAIYYYYYNNYSPLIYENAEGRGTGNVFSEGSGFGTNTTWNNTLTYTNTFATNHNVKVLAGSEAIRNTGRSLGATRGGYFSPDPNFLTLNTGAPNTQQNSGAPFHSALFSIFGRLDYAYADKYLVSGTIRRDGASVFHPDYRYSVFPSASAAWRISRENFMRNIPFINDLKLRFSWGKLGSISNVGGTNAFSLFNSNIQRSFYDINGNSTVPVSGFYSSTLGNEATTFEEDIISNYGLDVTLFRNKFDMSIEYYKKSVSGLLFVRPIQDVYGGAARPLVNIGDIQNTGIDANLTYHGRGSGSFRYDITATFTTYKNKIVTIPGGYLDINTSGGSGRLPNITRAQEGHSVGEFFGYKVLGIFQSADEVAKAATQADAKAGRFRYADVNGDNVIDVNDRTWIGDPNPDFTYGLNLSASYKSFDFSAFLYGSQGNDIVNYVRYFTDFPQVFKGGISREAATNSWTPQNPNAKVPMLETFANFSNTAVFNSYYVENGSFLRAKQVTLGYTLPDRLLGRVGIDRLRVYVQSANLFTITKYSGLDPELQTYRNSSGGATNSPSFGIDYGNYPHTRSWLFGLSVGF